MTDTLRFENTPERRLYTAVWRGNEKEMNELISQGANPLTVYAHSRNLLHIAAWFGHPELILSLVEKKVPVDDRDSEGYTPLRLAIRNGKLNAAQALVNSHASLDAPNDEGRSLLHDAVAGGDQKLVDFLIGRGADIHARDNTGATPLHMAVHHVRKPLVSYLHRKEADWSLRDNRGRTPLDAMFDESDDRAWFDQWQRRLVREGRLPSARPEDLLPGEGETSPSEAPLPEEKEAESSPVSRSPSC